MVEFIVTVPAGTGGGYYIDGVQKPIIPIATGETYRFNQNAANNNGHPLILSTTTSTAGIISTGVSYYLDGASNATNYRNTSLFNAATVRYIEITVTQTSDFYYICNVHGSSMGNVMDITITSNTWGALNWGQGNFGGLNDVNVSVTENNLVTDIGNFSITADANIIPTDNVLNSTTDSVSFSITGSVDLSTNLLTTSIGTLTAEQAVEVEVTSPGDLPWSSESWGYGSWGNIGGMDISIGADTVLTPSVEVDITGNQLNTTTGTFSITGDASLDLTGISFATTTGIIEIREGVDADVTGQSLATTLNTITITADANIDVNGSSLTISLGDAEEQITSDVFLTGNGISIDLGSAELDANTLANVTSVSASTTINSVSIIIDVAPAITGLQMTSNVGRAFISAWAVIDIGVTNNWSVVDIAA